MRLPAAETENEGPNLTPVIDVVFLLLIFFLVATRFTQEEKAVSLRLAEILKAEPISSGVKEVVVNITQEGKFIVLNETFNESQLIDLLADVAKNNPTTRRVQIRTDQEAKVKYPLTVVGICKEYELDYSFTVLQKRET